MKIKVLTLCKNEEIIIPYFIQHYISWVDEIVIIDGNSTDKSLEIAKSLGKDKVRIKRCEYDSGNEVNDDLFKYIRNNEWKENAEQFDWIIVCDADEFLYHENLYEKLINYKNNNITLPRTKGYHMIGTQMPVANLPLTSQIKKGTPDPLYNKNIIFNPKVIKEINYDVGSHTCEPVGNVKSSEDALTLLHYRKLSYSYCLEKAKTALSRMSQLNMDKGWGWHNLHIVRSYTADLHMQEYNNAVEVIK